MKVFISWSGDLSHKLAHAFHTWLPGALQTVRPYFTPADVEKGARWSTEIAKELESSDVGVLFVTRENVGSAWLLYEAGALAKRLEKSRVCPIIFGLSHADLPGPLRQFQATEFKEEDFRKLLKTINSASGENKLSEIVLDQVFEMWWPRLEEKFRSTLDADESPKDAEPLRTERELLEEILELSRLRYRRETYGIRIPPKLVVDLVMALKSSVNALHEDTDPQSALEAMSSMRGPIAYLLRRSRMPEDLDVEELLAEVSNLSFEYQTPAADDEIPF